MSVELRELRYFLAVAEELNFTRAAARVHLAQQGLSMAIRQMEQRLGVALFDRSTRRVGLTAAGEALVPHARKALAAAAAGEAAVQAVMRGERGHLRIGFCATSALDLTPKLLRTFTERYPDVSLSVRQFGFEDPTGGLRDGSSDVALVRPPFNDDGLVLIDVLCEARWVVLPTAHRLADAEGEECTQRLRSPLGPRIRPERHAALEFRDDHGPAVMRVVVGDRRVDERYRRCDVLHRRA